jgi:hypothetical protein
MELINNKFFTCEGPIIESELLEDMFLGLDALNPNIPDDAFSQPIEKIMSEDPEAIFLKERRIVNGIESTYEGTIDITKEPFHLVYGAKEMLPPPFQIKPDFTGAIITMEFVFKWFEDETTPFPMIPVADISVPHNLKENTFHQMDMEIFMHKQGAVLYDPSYDVKSKEVLSVDTIDHDTPLPEVIKITEDRFLFSSRHGNIPLEIKDVTRWLTVSFNPTHPMAAPYIVEIEKKFRGEKSKKYYYVGKYKWGRRIRSFYFDPWDRGWRVHSDMWIKFFGPNFHYMACFDLVSNFDFLYLFVGEKLGYKRVSINSDLVIEPYSVMGPVHNIYSPMMCPRVSSTLRHGSGMSTGVLIGDKTDKEMNYFQILDNWRKDKRYVTDDYVTCEDVTKDYVLYIDRVKGHLIIHVPTGKEVYVVSPKDNSYKRNIGQGGFSPLFFEYTFQDGLIRVLKMVNGGDQSKLITKIYVKGGFFFRAPRNDYGCLIDPLTQLSLLDAVELSKKNMDGYLPYAARVPALVEEFEQFVPLMEDVDFEVLDNNLYRWQDDLDFE